MFARTAHPVAHFPYDSYPASDGGYDQNYYFEEAFDDALASGDRVCSPSENRHAGRWRRRGVALLILSLGVWIFANRDSDWMRFAAALVAPLIDKTLIAENSAPPQPSAAAPASPAATAADTRNTNQLAGEAPTVVPTPAAEPALSLPPVTTVTAPQTPPEKANEPPSAPLDAPTVDPSDPYQKRAAAVGLHPHLSHVLLAKLTSADYRNARTAIDSAMVKTPENGTFAWPPNPKPRIALFTVHFVPGAPHDCRRYVVTIAKDGWATTAQPMEKCGASVRRRT